MQKDIRAKLAVELTEPINSERQVVYIMVELRKLLEVTGEKKLYPALVFHSDWVAHPSLDRNMAEKIVIAVNKQSHLFHRMSQMKTGDTMALKDESDLNFWARTVALVNFRADLSAYLHRLGIDDSIANDDEKWANLLRYYGEVIRDCPLRCVGKNLKFVDEVVVEVDSVQPETTAKFGFTLRVKWKWTNKVERKEYFAQQFF